MVVTCNYQLSTCTITILKLKKLTHCRNHNSTWTFWTQNINILAGAPIQHNIIFMFCWEICISFYREVLQEMSNVILYFEILHLLNLVHSAHFYKMSKTYTLLALSKKKQDHLWNFKLIDNIENLKNYDHF